MDQSSRRTNCAAICGTGDHDDREEDKNDELARRNLAIGEFDSSATMPTIQPSSSPTMPSPYVAEIATKVLVSSDANSITAVIVVVVVGPESVVVNCDYLAMRMARVGQLPDESNKVSFRAFQCIC